MRKRINPQTLKFLKESSKKFSYQIEFLNQQYGFDKDVLDLIKSELNISLSTSQFSKMQSLYKNSEYVRQINPILFTKVFEIIDPILEKKYNRIWSVEEQKLIEFDEYTNNPRLEGLVGVYEGYSWDAITTEKTLVGTIHHFKVHVISIHDIVCVTQKASFTGKKIRLISNDRVSIELFAGDRRAFFIVLIGRGEKETLEKEKRFYVAYTDSGDTRIKSGLAILERSNKLFHEIIPEKKEFSFFEKEKDSFFIRFLENSQLIIS